MALSKEDLQAIGELLKPMNQRLDRIELKFDKMESRLDSMELRFDKMGARLDKMELRFDKMESRLNKMEYDIKHIKLSLENETNKNIIRIAEGHLDLSRKLNETIKIASDIQAKQEIQDIFLNSHESKMKALY